MKAPLPVIQTEIPMQPGPVSVNVDLDEGKRVILTFHTIQGINRFFFDPDSAIEFGQAVFKAGKTAKVGILIVGDIGTDGLEGTSNE